MRITIKNIALNFLVFLFCATLNAQIISAFKQKGKWGFKKGESILIESQYDTTFGFDQTNSIALVGNLNPDKKIINPLTKEVKIEYRYFYINSQNQKIHIKRSNTDSVVEVNINKHIPALYLNNNHAFIALVNGKKHLVTKKGATVIRNGYDNLNFTKIPCFYTVETKDVKTGHNYIGLLDEKGNYIIQQAYSKISINPYDSLIFCCTAGIKFNGSDDVYNYKGDKIHTSAKHIQYVSKNYAVYRLFESENSYVINDIANGKERPLKAEWVYYLQHDRLVILDGDWYFYDMKTDKRFPIDKRLIKYYNLDE